MIESTVRFPVVCPECGREKLTDFPVNEVAYALEGGSDISLVATCHDVIWTATELELEQINDYLRVLTDPPGRLRPHHHGSPDRHVHGASK
jgi:hypothetical protein